MACIKAHTSNTTTAFLVETNLSSSEFRLGVRLKVYCSNLFNESDPHYLNCGRPEEVAKARTHFIATKTLQKSHHFTFYSTRVTLVTSNEGFKNQ